MLMVWCRRLLVLQLLIGTGLIAAIKPKTSNTPVFSRESQLVIKSTKPDDDVTVNVDGVRREQRIEDSLDSIDHRLSLLESLRISDRLSVLESIGEREWRVEMLEYGVVATLIGNLVLGIFGLKRSRQR